LTNNVDDLLLNTETVSGENLDNSLNAESPRLQAEMIDMPVALKQSATRTKAKGLGSKSDLDTKNMLKWLLIGLGCCAGAIVVFLVFRRVTLGDTGIPVPEKPLPEGAIPTHLAAIQEHNNKMATLGKSFKE
jgi:hypothetical protein